LELFSKVQQPSTRAFLRAYPTVQGARAAWVQELAALLKQARYPGARPKAEALAKHLQQPCLPASEVITRTKSRLMLALVDQLEPLLKQIADYDEEIERLFLMHADSELFQALPGARIRLAPRLLAEMGDDRCRYANASRLQALAGTSPVLFQSGIYQKAHRRLGCIKPWRNALQQFAWQSTLREAWAKGYDQRKRAEGKSPTVAVRALANVWARIVYAVWKKKALYQTTTFEQARQAHAPRIA
jgi:transposase